MEQHETLPDPASLFELNPNPITNEIDTTTYIFWCGQGVAVCQTFLCRGFHDLFEFKEFVWQCYAIGYRSPPLVSITGFIMGLVLTIQSRPTLAQFGAESWIPGMVTLSLVREIAPVITALICAGKIASGKAELGS
jgi:phospholipid/cholesterol/gamma-HCH transport system permease protein